MSGTAGAGWMPPSSRHQRIKTGADFVKSHKPPDWLIDGIVQQSRLYACTSKTGHGKTAVWLYCACMVHSGRMIGNGGGALDVTKGNALILAGENPEDLAARMLGMAREFNLRATDLPYVLPGAFGMTQEEIDKLKLEIAALGVDFSLIVGDTAASFFPGEDENDNVEAGEYARRLRELTEVPGNPAVVVLSHPIKNATRDNLVPRGGGAFLNELDCNLTLWSDVQGETTTLHWQGKIRGPDFPAMTFRLRSVSTGLKDTKDRDEITVVVEPMSDEAAANQAKQRLSNEDIILKQIRDHPGRSQADMARDAGWLEPDGEPQRYRVHRSLKALHGDNLISQPRSGGPWKLTKKGEEYLN